MAAMLDLLACQRLDAADPLAALRDRFAPADPGTLYFDANSIGAMPKDAPARLAAVMEQGWRVQRRRSWSVLDWLDQPRKIGAGLAHIIGAEPDDVSATGDTTTGLFKLLAYAWNIRKPGTDTVLCEVGTFSTDIYVAQGLRRLLGEGMKLKIVESGEVLSSIDASTAIVYLSHVDYRASRRWDMGAVSKLATERGALTIWDLSHAAGAVRIELQASGADFAVTCGYKYLCGGPGSPALIWMAKRHQNKAWPAVCGWMGHADTFAFEKDYRPAPGLGLFQAGTPPVLGNAAMMAAVDIWRDVDPVQSAAKHGKLSQTLIALVDQELTPFGVTVTSPRDYAVQGGHVAIKHAAAEQVMAAVLDAGVVCSFRGPDSIRFGLGPLYTSYVDLWEAVQRLKTVLKSETWRDPKYGKAPI